MTENTFVHKFTKVIIDIMIILGIIGTLGCVQLAKALRDLGDYGNETLIPFAMIIFLSGALAVYILINLKLMYKTLIGGDPFVERNVVCLRRMAVACAAVAAIYLLKCFYIFTYTTLAISITFSIATLFCLTLKDIFKRAIIYKEENELTI